MDPVRRVALAGCLGVVLAACTISAPAGAAHPRPAQSEHVAAKAACPAGRLLPHEGRVEIEWVDFLQFGGRQYVAGLGPAVTIRPARLGPVITRVRCSLCRKRRSPPRPYSAPRRPRSGSPPPAG